jgi:DNA-binding FrmR family transcriptional regulator
MSALTAPRRGYASGKADYPCRLRKIEGQVRGLHLHHCVVNAARASEDDGQASLGEVASTIRQVSRL